MVHLLNIIHNAPGARETFTYSQSKRRSTLGYIAKGCDQRWYSSWGYNQYSLIGRRSES